MKTLVTTVAMLAACAWLFFLAPHHRRRPESFKPSTLGGVYQDLIEDMPQNHAPEKLVFLMLAFAGFVASFYAAALVPAVRWWAPTAERATGLLFVLSGLLVAVGAAANFVGMVISHMSFGWGGGGGPKDETAFLWIIPVFQLVFAVLGMVIGCSATVAGWATRMLGA